MRGQAWTGERVEEFRRMWDGGAPIAKIGLALGLAENSVLARARELRQAGVALRVRGARAGRPRAESVVARFQGCYLSRHMAPAAILDAEGRPTGVVMDPMTRERRRQGDG